MPMSPRPSPLLILASTSRYRRELLNRLRLRFDQLAPTVEETTILGELGVARSSRLALEKALSVAQQYPRSWVLGCDQVCILGDRILDKPGTRTQARSQLCSFSGQAVDFHTSIALLCLGKRNSRQDASVHSRVQFRNLSEEEIERYLEAEPALDCAGSFKSEGLGISLCESIESTDPTALIGLPLIAVCRLLSSAGIYVP